jgi:hypothetical protein
MIPSSQGKVIPVNEKSSRPASAEWSRLNRLGRD